LQRHHESEADAGRTYGLILQTLVWIVGFEIVLHLLGIRLTTLFAATGFFAIAVGFAAKNIVENFMSGGVLRLERIIRPGDLIVIGGRSLIAKRVGLRTLEARTFDGEEILVPNSMVAQSMVENKTRDDRLNRIRLRVGVSYESDLDLVRKTLENAVGGLEWSSSVKKPAVYLHEFGNSSVLYDVYVWIDDANEALSRKSDLHESVWWALKDAGITIAFPQLDLHLNQSLSNSA
jgi:potassium efflux system protein